MLPVCLLLSRANPTLCMDYRPKYWGSLLPPRVASIQMDPQWSPSTCSVQCLSVRVTYHHFSGFVWEWDYLRLFNRPSWPLVPICLDWGRKSLPSAQHPVELSSDCSQSQDADALVLTAVLLRGPGSSFVPFSAALRHIRLHFALVSLLSDTLWLPTQDFSPPSSAILLETVVGWMVAPQKRYIHILPLESLNVDLIYLFFKCSFKILFIYF